MVKSFNSNKGELLSIWWFFILIIIGIGIVGGAFLFFGEKMDIRATQA